MNEKIFYPYRKPGRPGTIRHAIAGAALGLGAMAMIKPVCWWMVTAGTWLETVLK